MCDINRGGYAPSDARRCLQPHVKQLIKPHAKTGVSDSLSADLYAINKKYMIFQETRGERQVTIGIPGFDDGLH